MIDRRLTLIVTLRVLVAIALLSMALTGTATLDRAAKMPAVTDEGLFGVLRNWHHSSPMEQKDFLATWHAEMDSIQTGKWELHDAGRGLLVGSLTIATLIFCIYAVRRQTLLRLTSPGRPRTILLAGNFVLLAWWVSYCQLLTEELNRGLLPPSADTIGIPAFTALLVLLLTAPFLNVAGYFMIRKRSLPVRLWAWNKQAPIRSWTATLLFGLAMLLLLAAYSSEILQGAYLAATGFLTGTYVLLSARAALVFSCGQQRKEYSPAVHGANES